MGRDTISILDGSTFVVSDRRGDIDAGPDQPHGLFFRDTRFLSRWILTVEGRVLDVLSTDDVEYFSAQFFLYPPTGTIYKNPVLSVIRRRTVGDAVHEDIVVLNHGMQPLDVNLRLEADSDFADVFEVKDALKKKGRARADSCSAIAATTSCARRSSRPPPMRAWATAASRSGSRWSRTGNGARAWMSYRATAATCAQNTGTARSTIRFPTCARA